MGRVEFLTAMVLLSVPLALLARLTSPTSLNEEDKLLASDGAQGDEFGWSVSISGETVVVAAIGDDDNGEFSGSAYVFVRSGDEWTEQDKVLASDGAQGDEFGWSVSISGDIAVVGTPFDDDNGESSGSAYVFVRVGEGWTEEDKLLAGDGEQDDRFGLSVSVSGDTALVGALWADDNGNNSGSAYVFVRSGDEWTEQDKLLASDGAAGDLFGVSVSVSGDTALVGATGDDDGGIASGSAYVFVRSGDEWVEQDKLLAVDGAFNDLFGSSVSVSGDTALVGAPWDDNGDVSGSAYVFVRNGDEWTQQDKLLASDGEQDDEFGIEVSISGDIILIGARGEGGTGSAYLFGLSGGEWTEQAKLLASDGAPGDSFGDSVSIVGDTAIVGTPYDNDNGSASGSAYVFRISGIFSDGFESGDTSAWFRQVPPP